MSSEKAFYICSAAIIITIALCITYYNLARDPRIPAMMYCTAGDKGAEKQVACAREIFGGTRDQGN